MDSEHQKEVEGQPRCPTTSSKEEQPPSSGADANVAPGRGSTSNKSSSDSSESTREEVEPRETVPPSPSSARAPHSIVDRRGSVKSELPPQVSLLMHQMASQKN